VCVEWAPCRGEERRRTFRVPIDGCRPRVFGAEPRLAVPSEVDDRTVQVTPALVGMEAGVRMVSAQAKATVVEVGQRLSARSARWAENVYKLAPSPVLVGGVLSGGMGKIISRAPRERRENVADL